MTGAGDGACPTGGVVGFGAGVLEAGSGAGAGAGLGIAVGEGGGVNFGFGISGCGTAGFGAGAGTGVWVGLGWGWLLIGGLGGKTGAGLPEGGGVEGEEFFLVNSLTNSSILAIFGL